MEFTIYHDCRGSVRFENGSGRKLFGKSGSSRFKVLAVRFDSVRDVLDNSRGSEINIPDW